MPIGPVSARHGRQIRLATPPGLSVSTAAKAAAVGLGRLQDIHSPIAAVRFVSLHFASGAVPPDLRSVLLCCSATQLASPPLGVPQPSGASAPGTSGSQDQQASPAMALRQAALTFELPSIFKRSTVGSRDIEEVRLLYLFNDLTAA